MSASKKSDLGPREEKPPDQPADPSESLRLEVDALRAMLGPQPSDATPAPDDHDARDPPATGPPRDAPG